MAKYEVKQTAVSQVLADVRSDKIAIPELQRPFVWKTSQVRDLMDSLYNGYPVGYLITWQSVGAKLKGGEVAAHQQILIDGQQRVTALRAAVAGQPVVGKRYQKKRIAIAFNPLAEEFATRTPAISNSRQWIDDISEFFSGGSQLSFLRRYFNANPDAEEEQVESAINKLAGIEHAQVGVISLNDDLDVETVAEIFVRINAKGVPLSSADFVMSKIATYGDEGRNLRKLIDYFCHLTVSGHAFDDIRENDEEFAASQHLEKIQWLKRQSDELFQPEYTDVIRIAGLVGFSRGKAGAIVSELSGLDPETRKIDESRIPDAYARFSDALDQLVRKTHLERFVMMIKSAGFIDASMIGSKNALNFAYALYLRLRNDDQLSEGERARIVKRWFVMTLLTGRAVGSFESTWETDLRRISEHGADGYLRILEKSELGDGFWKVALLQELVSPSKRSPAFQIYLAALVSKGVRGFLSKSINVAQMIEGHGDMHHIVPKNYLIKNGFPKQGDYNQVANFALTETPINIAIKDYPPQTYMAKVKSQCDTGELTLGEITHLADLQANLRENAIPDFLDTVTAVNYRDFLAARRKLMAQMIRHYYESL
ncbi:GmrSD restriction endonuclease domain-containing protein [Vreelandella alkaliphila]|uniref:GmrSD restriction endonuclease domain-containing protein n=1 Tax=Vreelandella alkaliphila TaxID=272774 RepID=UPI003F9551F7